MKKLLKSLSDWIASLTLIGALLFPFFAIYKIFSAEEIVISTALVTAVILEVVMLIVCRITSRYAEKHCKYCGHSLNGAAYEYEELARVARSDSQGKVSVKSRVRFDYTCPHCGRTRTERPSFKCDQFLDDRLEKYCRRRFGR